MNKISVITINYNDKKGLKKTIDSVVSQTFKDFEFIIIDGGSNDGSVSVIEENKEEISYWVIEPDSGVYNAKNK
jgi:glycosyltransferase involved in cell wall biosynthesis